MPRKPDLAVDLDGTILEYRGWADGDVFGQLIPGAKEALEELSKYFRILIWTCRGDEERIREILDENEVPYDWINRNPNQPPGTSDKMMATYYLDDRNVEFDGDWEKAKNKLIMKLKTSSEKHFSLFYRSNILKIRIQSLRKKLNDFKL